MSTQESDILLNKWENGECLLEALRDRTPGRYQLSARGGDAGRTYSDIIIILDGSDEAIFFDRHATGLIAGNLSRAYLPAACTLKSFEELDDCVTAGTDVSGVSDDGICATTLAWTENCEVLQNPECPSE